MNRIQVQEILKKYNFQLKNQTDKYQAYELDGTSIFIYEYELSSSWMYAGEKRTRTSTRRSFTYSDKSSTSRAYDWSDIETIIRTKILKLDDHEIENQPINDPGFRSGQLLSDETESSVHRQDTRIDSNGVDEPG